MLSLFSDSIIIQFNKYFLFIFGNIIVALLIWYNIKNLIKAWKKYQATKQIQTQDATLIEPQIGCYMPIEWGVKCAICNKPLSFETPKVMVVNELIEPSCRTVPINIITCSLTCANRWIVAELEKITGEPALETSVPSSSKDKDNGMMINHKNTTIQALLNKKQ